MTRTVLGTLLTSSVALLLLTPVIASAVGDAADQICIQSRCVMTRQPGRKLCSEVPCADKTNGQTTSGTCSSPVKCKADSSSGGLGDISKLMQSISQLMQSMKGSGGGGGGGSSSGAGQTPAQTGCTSYYQVSQPSSDPCAYYVPPVSSTINPSGVSTCDALSQALGTCGSSNTPSSVPVSGSLSPITTPDTSATEATSTSETSTPVYVGSSTVGLTSGVSGNIRVGADGATVFVNKLDVQQNTEVSGFYGSNTSGTMQPANLAASWCQTRPWDGNFLSFLIPPAFFDSLCSLNGYQVGMPQPAPKTGTVTTFVRQPAPKPIEATPAPANVQQGEADIWAVPASVRLGARTTIFWSAKNVTSCVETSPDGSFSQTSLSGGAATVPLTGPTTFTISCDMPGSRHITNYVTVGLAP